MPRFKGLGIPIEEVAMFLFFVFAIIMISLPFLALMLWSKGFRWILVLILIWISAAYLASKAGEETESHNFAFPVKRKPSMRADETGRASELISRGEIGYTLSQDVVYDRLAAVIRKGLLVRDLPEREMLSSADPTTLPLRELLRHEKRKASGSMAKRFGFKRDRHFIERVSNDIGLIERWLGGDI